MLVFLFSSQATRFRTIARRHKNRVKLGRDWKKRTDAELWRKVLSQVVVPGNAEPGYRLEHDPKVGKKVSIRKFKRLRSDAERQKYLISVFRDSPGQIRRKELKNDKKAAAAAQNFRKLMKEGGPKEFFKKVASRRSALASLGK